jgi:hypothetical protein
MRNLLRWMGYGFVASLFLGNTVADKANILWTIMLLCMGFAVVNWILHRTADVDLPSEATEELPKNVIPMRRVR